MLTWAPYAEIVVDVTSQTVNRGFHYSIPEELRGQIRPGIRVIVPFGNRRLEGYVIRLAHESPVASTKSILKVVDSEPLFTQELLDLALWLAQYYMCTITEVLQCMMPTGIKLEGKKVVSLTSAGQGLVDEGAVLHLQDETQKLNDVELKLLQLVNSLGGTVAYKMIIDRMGTTVTRYINSLVSQGFLTVETVMASKVNKKYRQVLRLGVDVSLAEVEIVTLRQRAPKQARVLAEVMGNPNLTVTEVAATTEVTPATVKALVDKGLLITTQEEEERDPYAQRVFPTTKPLNPTREQAQALEQIGQALATEKAKTFLLHGVTGSGKTEIYLQAIASVLEQGRQAIVLVPEISLTPQMVSRFKGRFGAQVAVLHSRLSLGERYDEWCKIREKRVNVVVGARSAVFAPFDKLGLIIIDEEHESSYKQEDRPRYHARSVALKRAELTGSVVVLGSATPAVESFYLAEQGYYQLISLRERIEARPMPVVELVDLRDELREGNRSMFSRVLQEKMLDRLTKGEQIILFLNRRGYSTFVLCRECGLVMKCPHCDISLTYHISGLLQCHYCNHQESTPDNCPKCQSKYIRHFGTGTQKVEEELRKTFPLARIQRMDVDTTGRKGAHEQILDAFQRGDTDILIGTQMIAKGLDFPNVTLVGVIAADTALNLPDFRSGERTFQLLTQVAGRAGRDKKIGEVVVQTYSMDHYSIQAAQHHDYPAFYEEELALRKLLEYPPYNHLIRIVISGEQEQKVIVTAQDLGNRLVLNKPEGLEILGPAPAPISKIKRRYRWHLAIKSADIPLMNGYLTTILEGLNRKLDTGIRVVVDVDPSSML